MSFPGDEDDSPEKNREQNGDPNETDATVTESEQDQSTDSSEEFPTQERQTHPPSSTQPGPSSTQPGPSSTQPGPSSTQPGPSSTQPGPSSTRRETASGTQETEEGWEVLGRDILTSIVAVLLLGGYIFMMSGVWPPMVAVESGSMEPNLEINDLVFVMDNDRFHPSEAHADTGIVTAEAGAETGYTKYGDYGDVIVFAPAGEEDVTPVIHRAMLWVDEGEDWYDRANEEYLGGGSSCDEIQNCPAPNDGFITKGDNNPTYDQTGTGEFDPVETEWVIGTAEQRVPGLGWLRLQFE